MRLSLPCDPARHLFGLLFSLFLVSTRLPLTRAGRVEKDGRICTVIPSDDGGDDSAAIITAFEQCSVDASVVFLNTTYHIERVMKTTGLRNVKVDLGGTLLVRISVFLLIEIEFAEREHGDSGEPT